MKRYLIFLIAFVPSVLWAVVCAPVSGSCSFAAVDSGCRIEPNSTCKITSNSICKKISNPSSNVIFVSAQDLKAEDWNSWVSNWAYQADCDAPMASCPSGSQAWGSCSGPISSAPHGASNIPVNNTASGFSGSAQFSCVDGSWQLQSGSSCSGGSPPETYDSNNNLCNAPENASCAPDRSYQSIDECGCYANYPGVQTKTVACQGGKVKFMTQNYSQCP